MKPLVSIGFLLFLFFCIISCQKTGTLNTSPNPAAGATTIDSVSKPDTIYVLTEIIDRDNGAVKFGYDMIHHRYTYVAGNSTIQPDTTFLSYNDDGTVFSVEKNGNGLQYSRSYDTASL